MTEFGTVEITSQRAVVAAGTGLAADAARDVLVTGGNVVDAAIAASAVLCVVMPQAVALGGDLFAMIRSGRDGTVTAVNATGAAPAGTDIASFRARGHAHVPLIGPLSIQPPGLVAGWQALHDRWGTRTLDRVLSSAIGLAKDGFPAGGRLVRCCVELEPDLRPIAGGRTASRREDGCSRRAKRFGRRGWPPRCAASPTPARRNFTKARSPKISCARCETRAG